MAEITAASRKTRRQMMRRWIPIIGILVGCQSVDQPTFVSLYHPTEIHEEWVAERLQLHHLKEPGPYQMRFLGSRTFHLSLHDHMSAEVILAGHDQTAPLAILQHGNLASAQEHLAQGAHLASWGFHVLVTTQVPEREWMENGVRLGKLVDLLAKSPQLLDHRFSTDRIILIGHSFGGSAVSLASTLSSHRVRGLILLDPAIYSPEIERILPRIHQRTVLIGADRRLFLSKKRALFGRKIPQMIEWSLHGATHNDAQLPTERQSTWGFDWSIDPDKQKNFLASMTLAMLSLSYDSHLKIFRSRLSSDPSFRADARLHP